MTQPAAFVARTNRLRAADELASALIVRDLDPELEALLLEYVRARTVDRALTPSAVVLPVLDLTGFDPELEELRPT